MTRTCVFCDIVAGTEPADVFWVWPDTVAITPRHPVTDGHLLVIPTVHVEDFREDPVVSASTMARAAWLANNLRGDMNLITSAGAAATQTVLHLHIHLVPRLTGDGLTLPWTGQHHTATDVHTYLSTGCRHGEHDYCRSTHGGRKRPASCKFCDAPCICPCHTTGPADAGRPTAGGDGAS